MAYASFMQWQMNVNAKFSLLIKFILIFSDDKCILDQMIFMLYTRHSNTRNSANIAIPNKHRLFWFDADFLLQ